jgi:drug/metabolite transporter (DMT)-like permease
MASDHRKGLVAATVAALLFGLSTPLVKRQLAEVPSAPVLAGLLYLGAAVAVAASRAVRGSEGAGSGPALTRRDVPALVAVMLCGGVIAPLLLVVGLRHLTGLGGSLLLTLEGPATVLLALIIFGDRLGRRAGGGAGVIFLGALLVAAAGGGSGAWSLLGASSIGAACLFWAIDNNLTQRLSHHDIFVLVTLKCGVAGSVNVAIALALGHSFPVPSAALLVLAIGAVCYGASIVLDAYALRYVGAAREAALFATAPFVGAIASIVLFGDSPSWLIAIGGLCMASGIYLLVGERHEHEHQHAVLVHEHPHEHDQHHQHDHASADSIGPHTHRHRHERLTHTHDHVDDAHHRHLHGTGNSV